jgi:NTP pyrophosphatase (non-canonical NTP hydrolase)
MIESSVYDRIIQFRNDRNWKQFHNPKDLAISISLEASELLENFQWSGTDLEVKNKSSNIAEELADVMIYCALMADSLSLDMNKIIIEKLENNGEKYNVEKSYGSSKKYTELE